MRFLKIGHAPKYFRVRPYSTRTILGIFALFVLAVPPPTQQNEESYFALVCVGGLLAVILLWIWPAIWMYRDAQRRRKEGGLWLLIGILAPLIGPLIWLIIRNDPETRRVPEYYGYPAPQYYPPPQYYPQQYYDTIEVVEVDAEQGYNQTHYDPYQR